LPFCDYFSSHTNRLQALDAERPCQLEAFRKKQIDCIQVQQQQQQQQQQQMHAQEQPAAAVDELKLTEHMQVNCVM
jgi:hypothetical protein